MTTWNLEGMKTHLFICNGSSCMKKDGEEITLAIRDEIQRQALDQERHTTRTLCNVPSRSVKTCSLYKDS